MHTNNSSGISYGGTDNKTGQTGLHIIPNITILKPPTASSTDSQTTMALTTTSAIGSTSISHALVYILVPLAVLFLIGIIVFLIFFILRRNRIEKLRHAMMPVYSFDPEEEGADWESELLEEDREAQRALNRHKREDSDGSPRLTFRPDSDHLQL